MMMPTEHLALIVDDIQRDRLAAAEDYRRTRAGRARGRFPMTRRSAASR